MNTRYAVHIFDIAGHFREFGVRTFPEALTLARSARATYGNRKAIRVYNQDRMDLDFDGLTEAEREALSDAGVI